MSAEYHDFESVTFNVIVAFDGGSDEFRTDEIEIVDLDDVTDRRREEADLLFYSVESILPESSTDGEAAIQITTGSTISSDGYLLETNEPFVVQTDDTIDLIGRPLRLDGASSGRSDGYDLHGLSDLADPTFYARNEINAVVETRNTSATESETVRVIISGQMVFGLHETADASGR